MLLSNKHSSDELILKLEKGYSRMKCYGFSTPTTDTEMDKYFKLVCKYTENYEIFYGTSSTLEIEEISDTEDNNIIDLNIGDNSIVNNYKSVDVGNGINLDLGISSNKDNNIDFNDFSSRHSNKSYITNQTSYLEIGVEHGLRFKMYNTK